MKVHPKDLNQMVDAYIKKLYTQETLAEMYEDDYDKLRIRVRVGLQAALDVLEPLSPY